MSESRHRLESLTRGITLVTGTDTGVGKTVVTACLAAWLAGRGIEPVVVKAAQTGVGPDEDGDLAEIKRLAGVPDERLIEGARLPEPLAPTTAARRAGVRLASMDSLAGRLDRLAEAHQAILVEGAGGLLVGLDDDGHGLLELADALRRRGRAPRFVVVVRPGLGTLNHTALTVNAIRSADHEVTGLVVGNWPDEPDLAERCNLVDLPAIAPVLAVLPAGLGDDPDRVRSALNRPSGDEPQMLIKE